MKPLGEWHRRETHHWRLSTAGWPGPGVYIYGQFIHIRIQL